MKLAQEVRTGNVIMLNGNPMVVQKAEYSKSGRNAAVVKMKLKNLLSNGGTETVFRADDRLDDVILEHKDCTYSYYGDPLYVFMDEEFNQYEIEKDNMGDVLNYLIDGMEDVCQVTFYNGKAISVETVEDLAKLPTRDVLLATVLGAFQAPIAAFARAVQAIVDKNGEGEAAAE